MISLLYVGSFGIFGVLCRFGLDQMMLSKSETLPYGTLVINLLGCALAGVIFVLGEKQILSNGLQIGLLVGFCGGFTTFSAYVLQSLRLLEKGNPIPALIYFGASPILGILILYLVVTVLRTFKF